MGSNDFQTRTVKVPPCAECLGTNVNGDSRVGDAFMVYTCLDCGNQWVGDTPTDQPPENQP